MLVFERRRKKKKKTLVGGKPRPYPRVATAFHGADDVVYSMFDKEHCKQHRIRITRNTAN
jgi:hypothetical protein